MKRKRLALLMNGGGARAAYQAGILESWQDIFARHAGRIEIICGVSAGALNAAKLAQHIDDLPGAVARITKLWHEVRTGDIFHSELRDVVGNLYRLTRHPLAGMESRGGGILNNEPLRRFLDAHLDFGQIGANLEANPWQVLALNCFDYTKRENVTFFNSQAAVPPWRISNRRGTPVTLGLDHVMASSSVPFIFPPVRLEGHYYGDGMLRNITPLNSCIRLGAERIICINLKGAQPEGVDAAPSAGQIAASVLDSLFLDTMEHDSQVMMRVNLLTSKIPEGQCETRQIDLCKISPIVDFGGIAEKFRHRFPRGLRFLFGSWVSSEMLSYLLFEPELNALLMEHGRRDGVLFRDLVEEWFRDGF